jgi:hypothetical protein
VTDAGERREILGELAAEHIDVYDTKAGPWSPDHGDLEIPDRWEFLPTGDAFLTRTVKSAGPYWLSWQPKSRHRKHRRLLGLWAPAEAIAAARVKAEETAARRAAGRVQGARARQRQETSYQEQLQAAILNFLNFGPDNAGLAERIAVDTAAHAAVVGSSRVGRTQKLGLDERAALAARAHIRHGYTRYHDNLETLPLEDWTEDDLYRQIKGEANEAVDQFLAEHRRR